jgi:hypothetical protein
MLRTLAEAFLDEDGRLTTKFELAAAEADLGTTTPQSHAYRVRIEGEENALYYYWAASAFAMAQTLLTEQVKAWVEEKTCTDFSTTWTRMETPDG